MVYGDFQYTRNRDGYYDRKSWFAEICVYNRVYPCVEVCTLHFGVQSLCVCVYIYVYIYVRIYTVDVLQYKHNTQNLLLRRAYKSSQAPNYSTVSEIVHIKVRAPPQKRAMSKVAPEV